MGEDRVPSPVQRSFHTNKSEIDGWPILFGIGRILLFFFRSSVWILPLPRYTPPPSRELSSFFVFYFTNSLVFLFACFFFLLIWYIIILFRG